MTVIVYRGGVFRTDESRRKRTLACARERRAAGTVPVVRTMVIVLGIMLLLVAAADLVLILGVLI